MAFTFISGATGGIGKAFCDECAKLNYNLFLTGRSQEKLDALKAELEKKYSVAIEVFPCDLTSEISRAEMISFIDGKGLDFDRIINVAGVDTQKAFTEYTQEKLLFQLRVNVEGTVSLTHELLKRKANNLEIITVSSMSCVSPMPYFQVYSATKALLLSLFTSLHYELKRENVKVTTILPGGVYTRPDIIEDIKGQGLWGKLSSKTPEFVAVKSLRAAKKNKIKYIPGFFNKFLNFMMKIMPKRIVLSYIAKRWEKITKDAF
ncbi:MAG: SDR family NAD(P)-dependent oxidoreductase [Clostridia bacterium]|nr:SDR family NAD(P)-dependent oxidoreductase [Clostridia bacterium]